MFGFQQLISVHESTSLAAVLTILRKYGILAVPVYEHAEDGGKIFTGIVTAFDILGWTVFQNLFDTIEDERACDSKIDFEKYLLTCDQETAYFNTPVKELVGRSRESKGNWLMKSTDTVHSLVALFTQGGYHRVLVIDEEDRIMSTRMSQESDEPTVSLSGSSVVLLTQTDLIRYLWDFLGFKLNTSVSRINELSWIRESQPTKNGSRVIAIPKTVNALTAFRFLYIHRVQAVAIVDENERISANLSASDLRGLERGNLETLFDNVLDFLEKDVKRSPGSLLSDQIRSVGPSASADEAVKMMLESKIHRIWIQDADDKPIGLITMTDILHNVLE